MSKYRIKLLAEFTLGVLGAAITATLAALALQQTGDVNLTLVVAGVTAGINRFILANIQNLIAALTEEKP